MACNCSCSVRTRRSAPIRSRDICCSFDESVHLASSLRRASTYRCSFSNIRRKVCTRWHSNWRSFSCYEGKEKKVYNYFATASSSFRSEIVFKTPKFHHPHNRQPLPHIYTLQQVNFITPSRHQFQHSTIQLTSTGCGAVIRSRAGAEWWWCSGLWILVIVCVGVDVLNVVVVGIGDEHRLFALLALIWFGAGGREFADTRCCTVNSTSIHAEKITDARISTNTRHRANRVRYTSCRRKCLIFDNFANYKTEDAVGTDVLMVCSYHEREITRKPWIITDVSIIAALSPIWVHKKNNNHKW